MGGFQRKFISVMADISMWLSERHIYCAKLWNKIASYFLQKNGGADGNIKTPERRE